MILFQHSSKLYSKHQALSTCINIHTTLSKSVGKNNLEEFFDILHFTLFILVPSFKNLPLCSRFQTMLKY